MKAIVIGNGESRKPIDISKLEGYKIGCNGIYLHEKVDMVCAMDKFWRDKVQAETSLPCLSRCEYDTKYLEINGKPINIPDKGYASGTTAIDYACTKFNEIYLIGFDIFVKTETVNHIYKDTPFHPKSTQPSVSMDMFFKQTKEILWRNFNKNFTFVGECSWCSPHIKVISVEEFLLNR